MRRWALAARVPLFLAALFPLACVADPSAPSSAPATPGAVDGPPAPAVMGLGPAAPPRSERPAFLFLPNGAGPTPAAALKDLDRVMDACAKKPGFYRYPYYKIVQISRSQYEADGMCTWDAPDAKHPKDPRKK